MDGQLAVFGMDFRYDMRGPTGDYFTPLFIDLSDALGGAPFVVIETSDLAIAIVENGETGCRSARMSCPTRAPMPPRWESACPKPPHPKPPRPNLQPPNQQPPNRPPRPEVGGCPPTGACAGGGRRRSAL